METLTFTNKMRLHPGVVTALACALGLLGLWTSLQYSLFIWGTDADVALPVMLWDGIHAHGLQFLTTWVYGPSSWLLSLVPIMFVAYSVLGPTPAVALGSGWLIYLGCVAVIGIITWRVAGRIACMIACLLLLAVNQATIGAVGFLSYPVTHNISLLWGLAAVLAAQLWLAQQRSVWLLCYAAFLVINDLSDPWSTVAFTAPLLAMSVILGVTDQAHRRASLSLGGATVFAWLLIETKLLGFLSFISSRRFEVGSIDQIKDHLHWFARTIPAMLDPFYSLGYRGITGIMTWIVLLWLCGETVLRALRDRASLKIEAQLVIGVAVFSCVYMAAAFIASDLPEGEYGGRRLLNVYFFVVTLLAVRLSAGWCRLPECGRIVGAVFCAALMIGGFASHPAAWLRLNLTIDTKGVPELAQFLAMHDLHYGYGPYWGSEANAVSWMSRRSVLIRPVMFDPNDGSISPLYSQTSPLWYRAVDIPGGLQRFFVIVSDDGEQCPRTALCIDGLQTQFGPAEHILHQANRDILVWPRSALNKLIREM